MHQVTKRNYYLWPGLSPQSSVLVKATKKYKIENLIIITNFDVSYSSINLEVSDDFYFLLNCNPQPSS